MKSSALGALAALTLVTFAAGTARAVGAPYPPSSTITGVDWDKSTYRSAGVREFLGVRYEMHEYHWETRRIWGATARIIWQLLPLLDAARR